MGLLAQEKLGLSENHAGFFFAYSYDDLVPSIYAAFSEQLRARWEQNERKEIKGDPTEEQVQAELEVRFTRLQEESAEQSPDYVPENMKNVYLLLPGVMRKLWDARQQALVYVHPENVNSGINATDGDATTDSASTTTTPAKYAHAFTANPDAVFTAFYRHEHDVTYKDELSGFPTKQKKKQHHDVALYRSLNHEDTQLKPAVIIEAQAGMKGGFVAKLIRAYYVVLDGNLYSGAKVPVVKKLLQVNQYTGGKAGELAGPLLKTIKTAQHARDFDKDGNYWQNERNEIIRQAETYFETISNDNP